MHKRESGWREARGRQRLSGRSRGAEREREEEVKRDVCGREHTQGAADWGF